MASFRLAFVLLVLVMTSYLLSTTEARTTPGNCHKDSDCTGACGKCSYCSCELKTNVCECANFQQKLIPAEAILGGSS
ncbi:hypothetical protein Peur_028362 [Populus x canadensis]